MTAKAQQLVATCLLLMILMALLQLGCERKCETCPVTDDTVKPYRGWLFASADPGEASLYKIDCETGDVVDSVLAESPDLGGGHYIGASQDGKYVAVSYINPRVTRIYDTQTLAIVHEIPMIVRPVFVSSRNLLLGFTLDSVFHYTTPGFEEVFRDSVGDLDNPVLFEKDTLIYGVEWHGTDNADSATVFAYNYIRREKVGHWKPRDSEGVGYWLQSVAMHPDGKRCYFLGDREDGSVMPSYFVCYDLHAETLLFRVWITGSLGDVAVPPDGREVWYSDPGWGGWDWPAPGTIFIHDAATGTFLQGISLYGWGTVPGMPLPGHEIRFVPTGGYAFIGTGQLFKESGSVITVDTKKREVIHLTWPDLGHYPCYLALTPKL